jgi:hypothetical protein
MLPAVVLEDIREYRLVDGHVGVKGEGSCFNDLHATRNLMSYLANVMVEVYDEPNVEAHYAKLDVYAIAKYSLSLSGESFGNESMLGSPAPEQTVRN